MLNTFALVGNLISVNTGNRTPSGYYCSVATIRVGRGYLNENGETVYDDYPIELWRGIAEEMENAEIGKPYAVKGRLANKEGKVMLVAEKITRIGD